jgi:hypothetical protein
MNNLRVKSIQNFIPHFGNCRRIHKSLKQNASLYLLKGDARLTRFALNPNFICTLFMPPSPNFANMILVVGLHKVSIQYHKQGFKG